MRIFKSLQELSRSIIPSLELIDDIIDEVLIVSTGKRHVVEAWDLAIVLDSVANSISDILCLGLVAQSVIRANPHCDGDFIDGVKGDQRGYRVSLLVSRRVLLESLLDRRLGIMQAGLDRRGLHDEPL